MAVEGGSALGAGPVLLGGVAATTGDLAGGVEWWFHIGVWTLTILFAVGLLAFRIQDRKIRVLGMTFLLGGVAIVTHDLGAMARDPGAAAYWTSVYPAFYIGFAFAWVFFLGVYPHRRFVGRGPVASAAFLAVVVALVLAYLSDHTLWSGPDGYGPLFALHGGATLIIAVGSVVLMRDHGRAPRGPSRDALLLLAAGMTIFPAIHSLWDGLGAYATPADGVGPFLNWALSAIALPVVLVALVALLRVVRSEGSRALRVFMVLPATALAGGAIAGALARSGFPDAALRVGIAMDAFDCFGFTVVLVYGIVKYQMFDIDLRIKWTLRRGTVAASFVAVFLVGAQLAQNFLNDNLGWALGGVAAGLLVFAIGPLQRASERLADAAMPGVAPTSEYLGYRRLQLYRAAVEGAWEDGLVTHRERAILERLRRELGIASADAQAVEGDVEAAVRGASAPGAPS